MVHRLQQFLRPRGFLVEAGNRQRQRNNGRGKDYSDYAALVNLQRQIAGLPAVGFIPHLAFGVLDRDLALGRFQPYHQSRNHNRRAKNDERHEKVHFVRLHAFDDFHNRAGQAVHDTGKNDERNTIAHPFFRNLFAKPHHKHRAGGQR